eukprot:GDKJ01029255.1.p1 GENE.GDKJ01029255.1~~GDKJ01029255.1.p1  ORF type:complete len:204 (+),score=73.45 GDKJ01029255.1:41-613(+)
MMNMPPHSAGVSASFPHSSATPTPFAPPSSTPQDFNALPSANNGIGTAPHNPAALGLRPGSVMPWPNPTPTMVSVNPNAAVDSFKRLHAVSSLPTVPTPPGLTESLRSGFDKLLLIRPDLKASVLATDLYPKMMNNGLTEDVVEILTGVAAALAADNKKAAADLLQKILQSATAFQEHKSWISVARKLCM